MAAVQINPTTEIKELRAEITWLRNRLMAMSALVDAQAEELKRLSEVDEAEGSEDA